jgi:trimethylamine--corrinoid protein Co-methyltransferase
MIPAIRPKVELLSAELAGKILAEAYLLLDREGVRFENPAARALFRAAGMSVDEGTGRVRIAPELVRDCLATTPPIITLYDRSGEVSYVVGGDTVHFDPGSAGTRVLDHALKRERAPTTTDLITLARLTDALPNLHFQSTSLVPADVPQTIGDSFRLLFCLLYSAKPVVTGTFRVEGFGPMREMLAAVRGGTTELRRKPLAIFDACPSPPLKWSHLTSQSLIDCARAGIPSELISMGLTGATSPATLSGTLVQHVVENLAGLVLCQLAQPGAPVIFGGSPSSFDMRKGTTPMGAMETMMIDMAYAQLGKILNLPTHAYMALSDAKTNDAQAGYETGLGAALAALAGINVVSGPGMLDFESSISFEKLVIDDEICGLAYRLISGIAGPEDPLAEHLFRAFDPAMNFLVLAHTRKWYRLEHRLSAIPDRDTYDAWLAAGAGTLADRAAERVREILGQTPARLPPPGIAADLRRIMGEDARRSGVPDLPGLEEAIER